MEAIHFPSANNDTVFNKYKFLLCKRLFWQDNNVFYIEGNRILYFGPIRIIRYIYFTVMLVK